MNQENKMATASLEEQTVQPCEHMTCWVNGLADDSLHGIPRWYTRFHMFHCRQCRTAFEALRELRDRLRLFARGADPAPPPLGPERWGAIEAALEDIDERAGGGGTGEREA
jgi:hypothetical protein